MSRAGFEYGSLALAVGAVALATQAFSAEWVRSRLELAADSREEEPRQARAGSTQTALALLMSGAISEAGGGARGEAITGAKPAEFGGGQSFQGSCRRGFFEVWWAGIYFSPCLNLTRSFHLFFYGSG